MTMPSPTALERTEPAAIRQLDEEFDLALLDEEEVLFAGKPQADKLRTLLLASWSLIAVMSVVGILALPLIWWATRAFVGKHRYWLTTSRVVVTTGIIGYKARSIPLERVSDVAISCNWLERLIGMRSIMVRDMTGEAQSGAGCLAVANASEVQRQILGRVHEVNRHNGSNEQERMRGRSYREIDASHTQQEMLELLRRIEGNTRGE